MTDTLPGYLSGGRATTFPWGRSATMTTYPGDDEGLEATEVPMTARSAIDPDQGTGPETAADGGGDQAGPANSDPGD
jgi:hypothetical protein